GRVLDEEADKVLTTMKTRVKGRFATGQCDAWKNITKTSIVASMLNVEYKALDISAKAKNAENLLEIVVNEIKYCRDVLETVVVAWCTDSSGESLKMCRLLRERFPWIVTVVCWAHQLNLVVSDYLKLKLPHIRVVDQALEVIKWFNNHSRALGLLKEKMMEKLAKVYALILPVITRWTSHFLSCRRLLRIENAMRTLVLDSRNQLIVCAGDKVELKAKATEILDLISEPSFWRNLAEIEKSLRPLAIATYATEANNARLDIVLLTLGHLYHIFSSLDLEKRWKQADQEVFVLAVLFNPYLRRKAFNPDNALFTEASLWGMVDRCFRRMFPSPEYAPPDYEMRRAFTDYLTGLGTFSDEAMSLELLKRMADAEKSFVDLVSVWRSCWTPGKTTGPEGLVVLAMRILSIVPNSAATERLFSLMGTIHTDRRNRLDAGRVRKMALVKGDINTQ
ncbi:ribonuclease H-like domain-containing protein, partial [Fomitopsis serialis]|uniref:ribonuclease H-like domain-containing protein n=1 Tax=Fomitopsis serialis TaxID=139415 RepID=UPI002007A694